MQSHQNNQGNQPNQSKTSEQLEQTLAAHRTGVEQVALVCPSQKVWQMPMRSISSRLPLQITERPLPGVESGAIIEMVPIASQSSELSIALVNRTVALASWLVLTIALLLQS